MNKHEQFKAAAKDADLTIKQLVKLSMIQSEVYNRIDYMGGESRSDHVLILGDIALDERKMKPIRALAAKGFIELMNHDEVVVTRKGWTTYCNSGPMVIFMASDDDIIEYEQPEPRCGRF